MSHLPLHTQEWHTSRAGPRFHELNAGNIFEGPEDHAYSDTLSHLKLIQITRCRYADKGRIYGSQRKPSLDRLFLPVLPWADHDVRGKG
jgi:hypothetical protein